MALAFATMAACSIWSATFGAANPMILLSNDTVMSDIAVLAIMCAIVSARQRYSAGS